MIGKLTGRYRGDAGEGLSLVDVGGVGYAVRIPVSASLPPEGGEIELFIHTAVREDAIDLYGFPSKDALSFFRLLMSVSGIGPKTALNILSMSDIPSLGRAIARGDATTLHKLFGIGKKSAERIVVELKDKLLLSGDSGVSDEHPFHISENTDAFEALQSLGYSAAESRRALQEVPPKIVGVQGRLAAALKFLGAHASQNRTE